MAHSRATYGKKLSNGSNDGYVATSKTVYDDVFGGPPKFTIPTRVEDYSDIFGSYHSTRGSSIPILDLPVVEDEADGGLVDVRSSKFDYKEVFGGFDCVDFAVSYEELFASTEARGGGAVESSSSEDAWTPVGTGSPSEGSSGEPTCLDNKKAYSNGELPDAYHDVKLFNMSYQKTNQISKEDGISGTTHIAHLNAVPAYTLVVDEDIPLQSEKFGKSPAQEVDDNQSVNSNGGVVEGKDFQKNMSEELACGVPLGNSSGIMEEKNFNKILSDGHACDTFTKTTSSDVKSQSNLRENGTFPRKAFVTVTEINLRTQPTHVPPPTRPPPKLIIKQGESETSNPKASTGNAHERARGDDSPPFFDVEIDASSSAAASAAAMRVAMEKAQARLKSAKESMERKRDGLQNRKKLGLKEEIKRKERKEGEIVEEIKGSRLHNNFEIEEIGLNGFERDQRQREKMRDLNDYQESKGNMYVKGYRSTQHSGEPKRPGDWKAEEQFYELVKREKFGTFAEVPEQKRSERKSMPTTEVFGCEQNEKTTTKVAFEQQEGNDVKLKTAASKAQSEEDGKKHKEERELQESDNKVTEAFEREEHEKKLKEASELEENKLKEAPEQQEQEKKLREACEQLEQEKKLREARERQEQEKILEEAREQQEPERKHKESREQQELERKLRESCEQQEQGKRLEEAREQQEQEMKHKESRKQQELERKLREAQQEQDRKLKEALEMVEYEKKLKQAQEREEHERKLKESQEQKENELKLKEAHQREENEKRQKEAREREENEKRLKESRELEEYAKRLKEVQELEESKIKQKQVHEENERRLKEQGENDNKLKQALEQAKVACEREENEKKLRELQAQKDLAEACKKEETEKTEKEACEKEETEKREKEAFEKEENKKKHHTQVCEREDHETFKASQEFSGCNQGEENLIALKILRDIAGSESKMKADDDTFIRDIDTNSNTTHAASEQEENCEKLNAVQELSDHKENENMMKAANYASHGKENKVLKVASDQGGRERLTCMVQTFPEHKVFENKEEVNQEKLKEPEEVIVQEKTDKSKKPEQVAFDLEDDKSKHKTVQGAKQQVANGKKMEAAYLVSDLEEKSSNPKMSNEFDTKQNTERKEKTFNEKFITEEKEKEERLSREREQEKVRLRKIEEERERAREREKNRMAVERATREARERAYGEARERAERAAVERATAEVRQRALAEARERLERASAEAREKSLAERASVEARLRAERAAVDRATAEARERAEKAMAEKAAFEARERVERSVSEKFSGTSRDIGMRHSASFSDLRHPTYQSSSSFSGPLRFPNSSNHSAFANEKAQGVEVESAQRCKAKLERHQRTVERAAKALAEKNKRDVQAQREQAERNRLAETLDADVKRWSSGKEGNLRALLSTLQYILGPESGWQPVPLTDVITAVAVKKAYRKATLCVHPDKLQQRGANIQQKYICEKVFDLLKEAWNKFNSEER